MTAGMEYNSEILLMVVGIIVSSFSLSIYIVLGRL